ncbi:hypothetical protein [Tessaracoccus sp.]
MSALLRAELLRLVSRRLLVLLLVCMAALAAFGAAVDAESARPVTAMERGQAKESWKVDKDTWTRLCSEEPQGSDCEGWEVPASSDAYLRTPSSYGEYAQEILNISSPLALLAVAIMAAALVGAEFSSGNIGTQLLFTPRRIPLLFAKVVASSIGGVLVAATYLGSTLTFSALMFLSLRGAGDMTAGVELPLMLGRLMMLSLLIAVMAAALTMAVGSTLITGGILTVVFVGSVMLAGTIPGRSAAQLFLPSNIFSAMSAGSHELYDYLSSSYEDYGVVRVITYDWALGYSVIGTALIVAAAAWWFKRRDILR